jgi:hypothetical protein
MPVAELLTRPVMRAGAELSAAETPGRSTLVTEASRTRRRSRHTR